jgi:hypothetical protein
MRPIFYQPLGLLDYKEGVSSLRETLCQVSIRCVHGDEETRAACHRHGLPALKRGLPTGVPLVLGDSVAPVGLLSGLVTLTLGFS